MSADLARLLAGCERESRMAFAARRWLYREMDRRGRVSTADLRNWLIGRHPDASPATIEYAVQEATRPIRTGSVRRSGR